MTVREQLLSEIRAALQHAGTSWIEQSDLGDLFEAYVLAGLVQAARDEGWGVSLLDMREQPAGQALFRGSPGNIYASPSSRNFTHFVFERSGVPTLEAHIGIKVTGKSDVEHECDVALLPQDTARSCRMHRVHPRSTRLLFSAECKFRTSRVPLQLGREFVGLATELSSQSAVLKIGGLTKVLGSSRSVALGRDYLWEASQAARNRQQRLEGRLRGAWVGGRAGRGAALAWARAGARQRPEGRRRAS